MRLLTAISAAAVLVGCAASVALYTTTSSTAPATEKVQTSEPVGGTAPTAMPAPAPAMTHNDELLLYKRATIGESNSAKTAKINSIKKAKPNPAKIADDIIAQLEPANMVFSVDPKRSNISDQIAVSVLVDLTQSLEDLKKSAGNSEIVSAAQIRVSKVMIARVVAPNFTVVPITPEEQPISQSETTRWDWQLIPTKTGRHEIHITINAEVTVDGATKVRNIETFRETVEIEITTWQVVKGWISKYWQWSFSTLLLPLGIWLWKRRESKS